MFYISYKETEEGKISEWLKITQQVGDILKLIVDYVILWFKNKKSYILFVIVRTTVLLT